MTSPNGTPLSDIASFEPQCVILRPAIPDGREPRKQTENTRRNYFSPMHWSAADTHRFWYKPRFGRHGLISCAKFNVDRLMGSAVTDCQTSGSPIGRRHSPYTTLECVNALPRRPNRRHRIVWSYTSHRKPL